MGNPPCQGSVAKNKDLSLPYCIVEQSGPGLLSRALSNVLNASSKCSAEKPFHHRDSLEPDPERRLQPELQEIQDRMHQTMKNKFAELDEGHNDPDVPKGQKGQNQRAAPRSESKGHPRRHSGQSRDTALIKCRSCS